MLGHQQDPEARIPLPIPLLMPPALAATEAPPSSSTLDNKLQLYVRQLKQEPQEAATLATQPTAKLHPGMCAIISKRLYCRLIKPTRLEQAVRGLCSPSVNTLHHSASNPSRSSASSSISVNICMYVDAVNHYVPFVWRNHLSNSAKLSSLLVIYQGGYLYCKCVPPVSASTVCQFVAMCASW